MCVDNQARMLSDVAKRNLMATGSCVGLYGACVGADAGARNSVVFSGKVAAAGGEGAIVHVCVVKVCFWNLWLQIAM